MTIYYIYVKTHRITGLNYLGYTSRKDPHKYFGSGIYWQSHLQKHGYEYDTKILHRCISKSAIKSWGLFYSKLWSVVASNKWANLKVENGDGGFGILSEASRKKGVATRRANGTYVNTTSSKQKRLVTMTKNGTNKQTIESIQKQINTKLKLGITNKGRKHTTGELTKMRDSHLGSKNKSAKLTEADVILIKTSPLSATQLSILLHVSIGAICHVRNGRTWTHISV